MDHDNQRGNPAEFNPNPGLAGYVTVYMQAIDHKAGTISERIRAPITDASFYGPPDKFRDVLGEVGMAVRKDLAVKNRAKRLES